MELSHGPQAPQTIKGRWAAPCGFFDDASPKMENFSQKSSAGKN
jgi:hypothetical protein